MKGIRKIWSLMICFVFVITGFSDVPVAFASETLEEPCVYESQAWDTPVEEFCGLESQEIFELSEDEYNDSITMQVEAGEGMVTDIYGSRDFTNYASFYCRNKLNSIEQNLYNNLYHMCNKYLTTTISPTKYGDDYFMDYVSYAGMTKERACEILYLFQFQNPQFYFFGQRIYTMQSKSLITTTIHPNFVNGYTRADVTNQMFSKVDSWIEEINTYDTNYAKLRKANNIVCQNVVYNKNEFSQSAYSAVVLGETVCAGYAKLYALLTNGAGLTCVTVISNNHAWNVVELDGVWYNIDSTWNDNPNSDMPDNNYFLVKDYITTESHVRLNYYNIVPNCTTDHMCQSNVTVDSNGVYVKSIDNNHVVAEVDTLLSEESPLEYAWLARNCNGGEWFTIQYWSMEHKTLDWYPDSSGKYELMAQVRVCGQDKTSVYETVEVEFSKYIKGKCQMPYDNGGYLIGFETYDNPNGEYMYEMLILDCTLLAEGKDAWTYTTGKCLVQGNSFWTVWQPEYGYYWTLFRVYDSNGNLLDESCYGFENI